MSFDMNPADEDPHGECAHEIHKLQEAINGYLDVYECMTQGNYLKGFTLGREPREKLYAAVGREPLPENIPEGWQDPAMELGAQAARLKHAGLLSLSLAYGFLIGAPDHDIEQAIRNTIGEMERALIAAGAQADVDRIREGHRICMERLREGLVTERQAAKECSTENTAKTSPE